MAKKKSNRVDDDFDLDSFDDAFDFDIPDPTAKDDRKPVVKALEGFKEGAIHKAKTPAFYRDVLKKALPDSFGQAVDLSEEAGATVKNLYDESVAEIKPTLSMARKTIGKLVPADSTVVPKKIQDVLKRWREEVDEDTSAQINQAQAREAMIAKTLQETFAASEQSANARMAEQVGRDNLRMGVEHVRYKTTLDAMNRSAMALQRLDNYNTTVGLSFQRKSLELQYRQLYAMQDILAFSREDVLKRNEILASIAKNTALPEFVKITGKEAAMEMRRRKVFEMTNGALFGYVDRAMLSAIEKVKQNTLDSVKSFSQDFRQGLEQAQQAGEMAEGGMMGDPVKMAGQEAGGAAATGIGGWLAKKGYAKLKGSKLDKRFGIDDKFHQLDEKLTDLPNAMNEARQSRKYDYDDSLRGSVMSFLQGLLPDMGADKTLQRMTSKDLGEPAGYTKRTDRSITEIIPGFLSRILREVQVLRTGDASIGLTGFSHDKGSFTDKGKLLREAADKVVPGRARRYTQGVLDDLLKDIDSDENNKLSEQERQAIRKRLLTNSVDRLGANQERLGTAASYVGESPEVARAAAERMAKYLAGLSPEQRAQFVKRHHHLADYMSDPRQLMQSMLDNGDLELLREQGLITEQNGRTEVNVPEIVRRYLESGEDFEGAARPSAFDDLSPEQIAQKKRNMRLQNAIRVKAGKSAGKLKSGASKLKSKIKDKTPEAVKKAAMAAQTAAAGMDQVKQTVTQAASAAAEAAGPKVDQLKQQASAANDKLRQQAQKAAQALSEQYDLYVGDEKSPRILAAKLTQGLYRLKETGAVVTKMSEIKGAIVDETGKVVVAAQELQKLTYFDAVKHQWSRVNLRPPAMSDTVHDLGKTLVTNTRSLLDSAKATLQQTLAKPEEPADVYVEGEEQPRMLGAKMEQGEYADADTGQPIHTPADIKGPVMDRQGKVVVGAKELKNLKVFNYRLRRFSPLWMISKALGASKWLLGKAWQFQTGLAWKWTKWNFRMLGKGLKLAGGMLGLAKAAPEAEVKDVYVAGEKTPRLQASMFHKGEYFHRDTGVALRNHKDISGPVVDRFGNTLIDEQDLHSLMIYNSSLAKWSPLRLGKLFGLLAKGVGKAAGFVLGGAARGVGALAKLGVRGAWAGGKALTGATFGLAKGMLGIRREASALDNNQAPAGPKAAGLFGRFRSLFGMNKPNPALLSQLPVGEAASVMSLSTLKEISARLKKMGDENDGVFDGLLKKLPGIGGMGGMAAGALKVAGKVAVPAAAAAAAYGGIKDQADGKGVENAKDIIPDSFLGKLNPFSYAMNAGRYIGGKVMAGASAASTALGGEGSVGGDLANFFHGDPVKRMEMREKLLQQKQAEMNAEPKPANVNTANTTQAGGNPPASIPNAGGAPSDGSSGLKHIALGNNVKLDGLNPALSQNLMGMAQEYGEKTGKPLPITDGARSQADQARMYQKYGPGRAAPPGTSLHEFGLAFDADSKAANELDELGLMRKYGFTRPVGKEPWHIEPIGTQMNLAAAKQNSSIASQMIQAGMGKGGAGLGADPNAKPYGRSAEYSKAVLQAGDVEPSKTGGAAGGFAAGAESLGNAVANQRTRTLGDAEPRPSAVLRGQNKLAGGPADPTAKVPDPAGPSGAKAMMPTIEGAAKLVGIDKDLVASVIAVESGFNPNARAGTSSAAGLGQHTQGTWNELMRRYASKYGLDPNCPPTDPKASAIMTAQYLKDGCARIASVTGGQPGATEAYMAYFLGAGGATTFFKLLKANPNAPAATAMPDAARSNPNIFFDNGRARTVQEIYSLMSQKLQKRSKEFGIEPPQSNTVVAGMDSKPSGSTTSFDTSTSASGGIMPAYLPQPRSARASTPMAPVPGPQMPGISTPAMQPTTAAAATTGGIDTSLFAKTEDLLSKSLGVQTEMRDALLRLPASLAEVLRAVVPSDAGKDATSAPQTPAPSTPAYKLPKAPISMKRVIV